MELKKARFKLMKKIQNSVRAAGTKSSLEQATSTVHAVHWRRAQDCPHPQ